MAAPQPIQTSLTTLPLSGSRLAGPPRETAAPKARQARCSQPRSAPSVRLKMTGSGGRGGAGSEETWQGEGQEEQLGSQGLMPQPRRAQGTATLRRPSIPQVSEFYLLPPEAGVLLLPLPTPPASEETVESDTKTQYLYFEC